MYVYFDVLTGEGGSPPQGEAGGDHVLGRGGPERDQLLGHREEESQPGQYKGDSEILRIADKRVVRLYFCFNFP